MTRPKRRKRVTYPLVEVTWEDAHGDNHNDVSTPYWLNRHQRPAMSDAVGYLTVKNARVVVLSQHRFVDDELDDPHNTGWVFRDHLIIPRKNVKRMRRLR